MICIQTIAKPIFSIYPTNIHERPSTHQLSRPYAQTGKLLRAIEHYEHKIGLRDYVVFYFNYCDQVIEAMCNGNILLPSAGLLKDLRKHNATTIESDNELMMLYDQCINLSTIFYSHMVYAIIDAKLDKSNYYESFTKTTHNYGQQLITSLTKVKLRLKHLHCERIHITKQSTQQKLNAPMMKQKWMLLSFIQDISYTIQKNIIEWQRAMHCIGIMLHLACLFMIIYMQGTSIISLISSIILSLSCVAFVSNNPINAFEDIDISGTNLIAYHYRSRIHALTQRLSLLPRALRK